MYPCDNDTTMKTMVWVLWLQQ